MGIESDNVSLLLQIVWLGMSKLFQAMFLMVALQVSFHVEKRNVRTWSVLDLLTTSSSFWRTLWRKKRLMYLCLSLNGVSQSKALYLLDFALHGVLEKWEMCPWKVLEFLVQKRVWTQEGIKKLIIIVSHITIIFIPCLGFCCHYSSGNLLVYKFHSMGIWVVWSERCHQWKKHIRRVRKLCKEANHWMYKLWWCYLWKCYCFCGRY